VRLRLIPSNNTSLTPAHLARWSADSRRLAVADDSSDLYTASLSTLIYDFSNGFPEAPAVILPTGLDHPENLWGWSPDGHYLVTAEYNSVPSASLTVWQVDQARITYTFQGNVGGLLWSPGANALAYLWERPDSIGIGLVTADGLESASYVLPDLFRDIRYNDPHFLWSPNGDKVALLYTQRLYENTDFYLDVYTFDHGWNVSSHAYAYTGAKPSIWEANSPIMWTDNNTLIFWESLASDDYQMVRWSPGTDPVVERNSTRPPFFSTPIRKEVPYPMMMNDEIGLIPTHRIALYNDQEPLYSIDVMDLDGSHLVRFIEGADDAGDPSWSPNGNKVVAVWDADVSQGRQIVLSWMNADGSDQQDYISTYYDIQKVGWSPDEEVIVFTGIDQGASTYSLEMLDLLTGQHTVLVEKAEAFLDPRFQYDNAYVAVRWRNTAGEQFADGFARDGSRLYRVPISVPLWLARLFMSPDGQFAAIKEERASEPYGETLLLARTNGLSSAIVARDGLSGLGDPLWSPDSQWVAFTSNTNYSEPILLEVFNLAGERIWQAPFNYPVFETATFWLACPQR
jgi:Tol biopolymer transport system component